MNWYKNLMSPVKAGGHILKNRLVASDSLPNKIQGPETFPAEGFRALISQTAKSAAVVTLAEWNNKMARKMRIANNQPVFDYDDPSVCNYMSMLADEVHFHQSKIIMCMRHQFPEGFSQHGGIAFGPAMFMLKPGEKPPMSQVLPAEQMHEVVDDFVKRVGWYLSYGYDGFTMRCDMSLNKVESLRNDQYASDTIENRARLIVETYKAVKEAYGNKCLCEAIVAWEQPYGYGNMSNDGKTGTSFEEVQEFLKMLDPYVDIVQVRENDGCRSHPNGYNFLPGDHPAVEACGKFKEAGIKALLEPIGGFQDPEEMERILETGKCDLFGAARAFFADYDYAEKLIEGRGEDIVPCILCNKCHGTAAFCNDRQLSVCTVNPRHSNDYLLHRMIKKDTTPQKIAVIGGGAAGMRAAIEAVQRGHSVTLYEKSDRLGGALLHSDAFQFKWPIKRYKDWMIFQLGKLGVDVRLRTEPTPEEITAGGYDAVLAATGTEAVLPQSIEGLRDETGKALYPTCKDVYMNDPELGHYVVVVGGGITGLETAIHLVQKGHKVTLMTRQKEVGHDNDIPMHNIKMAFVTQGKDGKYYERSAWSIYDEEILNFITEASTKSVKDNAVTYVDAAGTEHTIKADSVVICGGSKKLDDEALAYAGTARKFYVIGDANGAGNIQKCNRQAYATVMRI